MLVTAAGILTVLFFAAAAWSVLLWGYLSAHPTPSMSRALGSFFMGLYLALALLVLALLAWAIVLVHWSM